MCYNEANPSGGHRIMTDHLSELGIKLFRSDRRTISIEIRPSGIIVRAPRRMSPDEISAFLTKKKAWIEKHTRQMRERQEILCQLKPYTPEELKELAEKALICKSLGIIEVVVGQ